MKIITYILIALAIGVAIFFVGKGCQKPQPIQVVEYDTVLIDRFVDRVERDTVIKWYERVVYQKSEPEKIYVQEVDSVFIETYRDHDVMLQVRKRGNVLDIYALNEAGRILKRYTYRDVQRDFDATAQEGNVFVKSKHWYWESPEIFLGIGTKRSTYENLDVKNLQLKQFDYQAGVRTGFNFKETIGLELEGRTDQDLNWESFLNLKLKF